MPRRPAPASPPTPTLTPDALAAHDAAVRAAVHALNAACARAWHDGARVQVDTLYVHDGIHPHALPIVQAAIGDGTAGGTDDRTARPT